VHNPVAPLIVAFGFTVIVLLAVQLPIAYVIPVVPLLTPVITPVEPITVAIPDPELHTPPGVPSVSVI
jgi:hypothetical protein